MSARKHLLAAAVVLALGSSGVVRAADTSAPPQSFPDPAAGPYLQQGGYCPTCSSGLGSFVSGLGTCKSCGNCGKSGRGTSLFHSHSKEPYTVNLCPGACFGYFQTQWHRWDEVCPYPYQGTGVSDAPKPPSASSPSGSDRLPKKPDGRLSDPRPVDPKTGLPVIPIPGKN